MATCSGSNRSSLVDEEVDFSSACECIAHDIEELVNRGNLLNERQCRELSSKILHAVGFIRKIKDFERGSNFVPFLPILYRSLENARLLVRECAEKDWTAVAVFQGQNESAFEEIRLEVWRCYNSLHGTATTINPRLRVFLLRKELRYVLKFRSSSLSMPISVSAIEGDREDLRRRLERLARDSSSVKVFGYSLRRQKVQKQHLARHLLQKFSCTSQKCLSNSSDVCEAGLWKKEMEPPGTWGNSNFLGSGSGASGVIRTQWLGVPCARKEFHGQASEVTFLKEASILSHLKHPRVVNFICSGNGEAKGDRFMAMELMEKSLFDVIEERRGVYFALPVAIDIILQIAEGMRYLHDQGVAHRDLKPQNVLVNRLACLHLSDEYYCVKLVDFGMSKTKVEVSKSDTMSFRGIGTTRYRAPEVHPKAHVGGLGKAQWFRVDVYSFAMTCAHVLTLKAPFEDMEQLSDLYASLLEGERPQLPSGLPTDLVDIIVDCWDTFPLDRPCFGDICNWLHVLGFKMLGGFVRRGGYPTIVRDNIEYADVRGYRARTRRKRMDNSKSTNSTSHTSFFSAEDCCLCDVDDGACD